MRKSYLNIPKHNNNTVEKTQNPLKCKQINLQLVELLLCVKNVSTNLYF